MRDSLSVPSARARAVPSAARMSAMNSPADARRLVARLGALEQLDERAADDDRVGDLGDRARACVASRMPKPTPTGSFTCARMRGIIAATAPMSRWPAPVTPFSDT